MKLTTKLLLGAATLTLVPIVVTSALVGGNAITLSRDGLAQAAQGQLVALREVRRQQVTDYVDSLVRPVQALAASAATQEGYRALRQAFVAGADSARADSAAQRLELKAFLTGPFSQEYEKRNPSAPADVARWADTLDAQQTALQHAFIVANVNPLGSKDKLDAAPQVPVYSAAHQRYHATFSAFRERLGFYDVFLIDPSTDRIIYTVFKETDFTTSLVDGIAAKTALGEVYRKVKASGKPDVVALSDYAPYLPSYDDQAAFVAVPLMEGGQLLGVLAAQLPLDKITNLMSAGKAWREQGLGASGETYLVGADQLMRTDSRFLLEDKAGFLQSAGAKLSAVQRAIADKKNTSIGVLKVDTVAARNALAGRSGFEVIDDYRGVSVFSAYGPLDLYGVRMGILAEIDESEALATATELQRATIVRTATIALLLLAAAAALAFLLVRSITRPVGQLSSTVALVASGDDTARSPVKSGDELQELGDAFNQLLDERIATLSKAQKENAALNESVVLLLQTMFELSQRNLTVRAQSSPDIVGTVADSVNMLADATDSALANVRSVAVQVDDSSRKVGTSATELATQAESDHNAVAAMTSEIASAAELMREVAMLAQNSSDSARDATQTTRAALQSVNTTVSEMGSIRESIAEMEKRVKRLGERSQEISQIVTVINSISERTHVLALNASMQAAMAGEAGRGFAVVTEEVQRLADSSRNATMQIAQIAQNIQLETSEAVAALNRTVADVVQGSDGARKSGEQMQATDAATAKLAEAVQRIANESARQLTLANSLAGRADALAKSSQNTAVVVRDTVTDALALSQASAQLVRVVGDFKLSPSA